MVVLENVEKYFNKRRSNQLHIINNSSFKVDENSLVAIFGESGSGKTTLLNVIGGLDKVNKGKIYINDKKITSRNIHKVDKIRNKNIGYIFQDYKLLEDKTVFENVAISLKLQGIRNREEVREKVIYTLKKLKIEQYEEKLCKYLSGGEKQRVAIARAIVKNPEIVLADEPTGNLDSENSIEIMNILKDISKERIVLLVTHEESLAKEYADRIIEIKDGKIEKDYINKEKKKEKNKNKEENKEENKNEFDLSKFDKKKHKIKYKSIYNIFTAIGNGHKQVHNYKALKKISLIVFFLTAVFIMYASCNVAGIKNISEDDFIKTNRNYIFVESNKISPKIFEKIEGLKEVKYIYPTNLNINFNILNDKYYQLSSESIEIRLPIATQDILDYSKEKILVGRIPEKENEVLISKKWFDIYYDKYGVELNLYGLKTEKDFIGKKLLTKEKDRNYVIVGVIDTKDPNVYVNSKCIYDLINNSDLMKRENINVEDNFVNYEEYDDNIKLYKGDLPENDYELILPKSYKDEYRLYRNTDFSINKTKLKLVGFYESNLRYKFVNPTMFKYNIIDNTTNATMYVDEVNKEKVLKILKDQFHLDAYNTYDSAKENLIKKRSEQVKKTSIVAVIIVIIAILEIYLIMNTSFISKIKEIGILRAIGVKRIDIVKMQLGEIIAILNVAVIPGIIISTVVLYELSKLNTFNMMFLVNQYTVTRAVILILALNIIFGLIPLFGVITKRPCDILKRKDI